MPPSAVTSTSSIIIRITTVHPFATSWPSSPKGGARTLRDLLSVSYGKITILLTGSLRSPPLSGLRRTSPRESVSHDSQVASLPYESCSLAPLFRGQNKTPQNTLFINGSTVSTGYSAPVEVLHGTSKWGEVRRLACPLRRFPFAAPPNCGGGKGTGFVRSRRRLRIQ